MVRGWKSLLGLVFALALVVGACAPTTRAAATSKSSPPHAGDAGAAGDEPSDREDEDGEAEASSEPVQGPASPCPTNMVLVASGEARFCVDVYEASLVETEADADGAMKEKPYPHWLPVDGHTVRAVSIPDVFPQGFISEVQAEDACGASGKRLCTHVEWKTACMGPTKTTFPYGDTRKPGTCHDTGKSAVGAVFGARAMTDPVASAPPPSKPKPNAKTPATKTAAAAKNTKPNRKPHATKGRAAETTQARATRPSTQKTAGRAGATKTEKAASRSTKRTPAKASARPASVEPSVWTQLNDPRLGQVDGTLAKTGSHDACVNGYGALDMVGNLHEWVKTDPAAPHGTFAGGYYLDTALNGDGCQYRTTAHAHDYHDYSTGFRCCADPSN
jgi:hypothetical protein